MTKILSTLGSGVAAVINDKLRLRPALCPRCSRPAWFSYRTVEEAERSSPICWGESEQDCPGYETPSGG